MDNEQLLQEELAKNSIVAPVGKDSQVVYLKGTDSGLEKVFQNATDFEDGETNKIIIPGPFTFGRQIAVDLDISKEGIWSETETHRHCKLVIKSPNAYSLNLLFDQFRLPEGAEFYVHDIEGKHNLGAFTSLVNNKDDLKFATTPIPGNVMVLEYFEPLKADNAGLLLHIKGIVHAFRDIFGHIAASKLAFSEADENDDKEGMGVQGISGPCNINAACSLGNNWRDQIRSVVVFMTAEGQKFCTGAMVNNALRNGKQYFLTANHCVDDPSTDYRYSILGFNFQTATCNAPTFTTVSQAAHGLILRARHKNSDFALFELTERIPEAYNVYMAGWSAATSVPAGTCAGIHHPSGDVKKISTTSNPVNTDCWTECPRRWHWRVNRWSRGVTEPGSSGSPLFSPQKLIIGQLHGGSSACNNPYGYDLYGGLFASYNSGSSASSRLIDWLNPRRNTRITAVSGANLNDLRRKEMNPVDEGASDDEEAAAAA